MTPDLDHVEALATTVSLNRCACGHGFPVYVVITVVHLNIARMDFGCLLPNDRWRQLIALPVTAPPLDSTVGANALSAWSPALPSFCRYALTPISIASVSF